MKDLIEKIAIYSRNGKKVMENPKTEISSHNDNRWPKRLASREPFRKVAVRSLIW
jgi:hypothetical protein